MSDNLELEAPFSPRDIPADLADWARTFFTVTERNFDAAGLSLAAENLRRYRSGEGQERIYSIEEIGSFWPFREAEDFNRTRFQEQTFRAQTGNRNLNASLLGLDDGDSVAGTDYFVAPISNRSLSAHATFGRSAVRSDMLFNATRSGDEIEIEGSVSHGLGSDRGRGEPFDFNANQLGSEHAQVMEALGEARSFTMHSDRSQDFNARVRIEPNGALTLLRARWGAIR